MWSRYISRYTNSHQLHFHLFGARSHLNHALLNPSPVPGRSPANPFCCGGLSLHKNPNGRWFSWRWGLGNPKNTSPNSRVYNLIMMYVYMYLDMYIIICTYVCFAYIHTNFFIICYHPTHPKHPVHNHPFYFRVCFTSPNVCTETKIYRLPCAARLGQLIGCPFQVDPWLPSATGFLPRGARHALGPWSPLRGNCPSTARSTPWQQLTS